jgi:hypothetical protein
MFGNRQDVPQNGQDLYTFFEPHSIKPLFINCLRFRHNGITIANYNAARN